MRFDVITLFPEIIERYFGLSIFKRAQKKKIIEIKAWQLRDFAGGRHRQVDDKPFGGGPGMVLKIEPIYKAVQTILKKSEAGCQPRRYRSGLRPQRASEKSKRRIILFSTRGRLFTQKDAQRLSKYKHLILICGRYEGIDERVARYIADEEISIGDFVLSGGEIPALIVIDAVSRKIPGILGKKESLEELKGSYPVYTRPAVFTRWRVPRVLLSGNQREIKQWRVKESRAES